MPLPFSANEYSRKEWSETFEPVVRWVDGQTSVLWQIQDKFEIGCELDLVWFPFDKQRCFLDISTKTSTRDIVYLSTNSCTDISKLRANGEFDVLAAECVVRVIISFFIFLSTIVHSFSSNLRSI